MKVALISGASGGIGKKIVEIFVKHGYFTVGLYNKGISEIKDLEKSLEKDGVKDLFFALQCDFSKKESVKNALSNIQSSFKHIDVLVNNAGIDLYKEITDTTEEEWDEVFEINVKSAFTLSKFALKSMIERKEGKIINVSSVWGISGGSMETAYSASKSALIGFTKALAKEVAPSNVNVNCVCPGVIDTKMNARFNAEEIEDLKTRTPLRRLGKAEEVAESVYFLASESSGFITGEVITVDGGFIL